MAIAKAALENIVRYLAPTWGRKASA